MPNDPVVIASAARTPLGRFMGGLAGFSTPQLGAVAIRAALERAGIEAADVSEVFMGCVLPAGLGQAPARQAAIGGGLPQAVGATTVNKVCGSGMKSVMLAHDLIRAGSADIVVAGGMESMSNAPYLLEKARGGYRMGHGRVLDHMFLDGLEDAYDHRAMGIYGDLTADEYGFSRDDQDRFAAETLLRAQRAITEGAFVAEIQPVEVAGKAGIARFEQDENPLAVKAEKIPALKPAFRPDGTVTAASSSANADGAAALVLAGAGTAEARGLPVLARIVGHATHSQEPARFTTAPIGAITKLLERIGWKAGDVDLWEINEAFAVVAMAAMRDLDLPRDRVNVHGGACALGHPIGATGARLVVTLAHAMERHGARRGVAALCIGGGEATAIAVERN